MEKTATAEQAMLRTAADTLDAQADSIVSRWLERVGSAISEARPGLDRQRMIGEVPALVHGVAEALRRGQAGEAEAPWTKAGWEHARLRQSQGVPLGGLVRELQALRPQLFSRFFQARRGSRAGAVLQPYDRGAARRRDPRRIAARR